MASAVTGFAINSVGEIRADMRLFSLNQIHQIIRAVMRHQSAFSGP